MGRAREDNETTKISEALVLATLSILGLHVDVHIIDGSIYSGIFYTASLRNGIVLKKARMIKKGKHNCNVAHGALINTLVVLPHHLLQLVAKDVMLPPHILPHHPQPLSLSSPSRQVQVHSPPSVDDGVCHHSEMVKEVHEVHGPNMSLNSCSTELNSCKDNQVVVVGAPDPLANIELMNKFHDGALSKVCITQSVAPEVSSSIKAEFDASRASLVVSAETSLPHNRLAGTTVKESKLNPCAKVFSPSFANMRTTPAALVATTISMGYAPNSIPAQPEVGMRPVMQHSSSWPVKFVPYVNPPPPTPDNGLQYVPPHITGHIATRAHPLRQGAQYQPLQAVPPYLHTTPQNAVYGRPSQVVYVHQVSHDGIQGPAAIPHATPHPLMASHPIHIPKHEGVFVGQPLQVSVTPPLVANVPQPYGMSNHIQRSHPVYSSIHHVPVLGSNVVYGAKFP